MACFKFNYIGTEMREAVARLEQDLSKAKMRREYDFLSFQTQWDANRDMAHVPVQDHTRVQWLLDFPYVLQQGTQDTEQTVSSL